MEVVEAKNEEIEKLKTENEKLKDKLNCCFCNPFVELNDIAKQQKCVEVTECFRRKLDQLKAEKEELKKKIKYMEEYIKTIENSRNEFEKENKLLKEETQK